MTNTLPVPNDDDRAFGDDDQDERLIEPVSGQITPLLAASAEEEDDADFASMRVIRIGESVRSYWKDINLGLDFRSFRESRDGLFAEVEINSFNPTGSISGHLYGPVHINLVGATTRATLAKACAPSSDKPQKWWEALIQHTLRAVIFDFRRGEPVVDLATVERRTSSKDLLPGILPYGDTTIIYGAGGSLKSGTALAMGISCCTNSVFIRGVQPSHQVNVLYLDWETNKHEQSERMRAMLPGGNLSLVEGRFFYRRCWRPLVEEITQIREEVDRHQIGLVVIDSLMYACGTDPESAESAIRTMNALRSLGEKVSRLCVAHMSKAEIEKDNGKGRIYGSVFWENSARSVFEVRMDEQPSLDGSVRTAMYHTKVNRGRKLEPIGLLWVFNDDQMPMGVRRADVYDSENLAARLPLGNRALQALRQAVGGASLADLAGTLATTPDALTPVLERLVEKGHALRLPNGNFALPARR